MRGIKAGVRPTMLSNSERFQPVTIATKVYRQLRADIINGVFPPGTHLVKRTLAKKYGVSVPPVIEACLRLENDGLVESSPLIGSYVMNVFPDKIEDELVFREAIESQIARTYAVRAGERERQHLLRLARELDELQDNMDFDDPEQVKQFQQVHTDFHLVLAKLSGAKLLYQEMKKLWFRRLMLIWNVDKKKFPNPRKWHIRLTEALNSGDPEVADRAMREHFTINNDKKTGTVLKTLYSEREQFMESLLLEPSANAELAEDEEDEK